MRMQCRLRYEHYDYAPESQMPHKQSNMGRAIFCVIDDILVVIQFPVHTALSLVTARKRWVWQHSPVDAALDPAI